MTPRTLLVVAAAAAIGCAGPKVFIYSEGPERKFALHADYPEVRENLRKRGWSEDESAAYSHPARRCRGRNAKCDVRHPDSKHVFSYRDRGSHMSAAVDIDLFDAATGAHVAAVSEPLYGFDEDYEHAIARLVDEMMRGTLGRAGTGYVPGYRKIPAGLYRCRHVVRGYGRSSNSDPAKRWEESERAAREAAYAHVLQLWTQAADGPTSPADTPKKEALDANAVEMHHYIAPDSVDEEAVVDVNLVLLMRDEYSGNKMPIVRAFQKLVDAQGVEPPPDAKGNRLSCVEWMVK